ncbi:hypothetical protein CEE86_12470, partial [Lactobacillus crispatus]
GEIEDVSGLFGVQLEVDGPSSAALLLDPGTVAEQLLQHRLAPERNAPDGAALRLIAEAMTQQAVGEMPHLGAADLLVDVGHRHGDVHRVEVFHAVGRIQGPVQHLSGFEVVHDGMPVVPFGVGDIDLDAEQRNVLEMLGPDKRLRVGIDVDALAAGDLDQTLPRQIGVVIDLRIGRRNQDVGLMGRRVEPGNLGRDLAEHSLDHV